MKTFRLLFLVFLSAAFHVSAESTNLSSLVSVDRPLADVKAALNIYYINRTNEVGLAVLRTNDVPGVRYSLSFGDCTFETDASLLYGDIVATSITSTTTRLELRTDVAPSADPVRAAREKRHVSRILNKIAEMAKGEP